jgi:2-polyprenyl-3-methyl-5-hydroxy-6-metoxy-1,4-benzoquinol methylase
VNAISYKISIPEVRTGKLLDIGCGAGSYLASMKQIGWDAYGVELSSVACELARKKMGLNVFNGTVAEASFPRDFFRIITMHQVLEHTQDPTETLCEIHRVLKADGLLAISVPDAESLESKIFGSAWHNWELPRHLYHFSRATITAMLEKNGFLVTDVKHDANPFGVLRSIEHIFAHVNLNPKIGFAVAYPLSFLIAIILRTVDSSGSMAIYARTKER